MPRVIAKAPRLSRASLLNAEARSLNASPRVPLRPVGTNFSGAIVSERSSLSLSSAYACVNVLSTDLGFPPLRVMQASPDGSRKARPDHPADALLRVSPDGETTAMRARMAWVGHVFGWGNGYQQIARDIFGRPSGLDRLDPATCEPKRRKSDNKLYYSVDDSKALRPDEVLHLAGLGYDGLVGYSPVRICRQAFGLGLATETFGAGFFGNGATPRGVIKRPGVMSDEAWDNFREAFNEVHQGPHNSNKLLLLEEGMEFEATAVSPEDAQFLETRRFQVIEVCRIYRVPPHKVMDYADAHYANVEESNLDYLMTTIAPWCVQIEQVCNLRLLTPDEVAKGFYVEHALSAFMRGNSAARAQYYKDLAGLGVLSPNQVAAAEGLDPIGPAGNKRLVPLNMTTLDAAGNAPETAQ
jgi:HK97 family phage portal protein